jgi:nucleoside-diphosphate-sugar epimerase
MTLRAIARPESETRLLDELGVAVLRGDLTDAALVRKAVTGAEIVVHCAAKVGDWGPVEEFRAVNVGGLRNLLEAAKGQGLERFVHMSSLGVYASRHHHGTDESEPLPARHIDGYTQSKVEAEQLALSYEREFGVPVVVLRPGFVYGPRDRTVLPRVIDRMRKGKFRFVGSPERAMNSIYVGNLVEAVFLAIALPQAVGEVYNLTDGEPVSKRRFFDAVAEGVGLEKPSRTAPLLLARLIASVLEAHGRWKGRKTPPALTRAMVKFLGLNLDFSIEKARRELSYRPRYPFDDAIKETMAWYARHS